MYTTKLKYLSIENQSSLNLSEVRLVILNIFYLCPWDSPFNFDCSCMKLTNNRGILKVLGVKCRSECFVLSIFYSKTRVKWPLSKRPKIGFQDRLSFNAGQKYCRMLQGEHSAILLTFIKLPFVIKIFVLSIIWWPFYTGLTVFIYI